MSYIEDLVRVEMRQKAFEDASQKERLRAAAVDLAQFNAQVFREWYAPSVMARFPSLWSDFLIRATEPGQFEIMFEVAGQWVTMTPFGANCSKGWAGTYTCTYTARSHKPGIVVASDTHLKAVVAELLANQASVSAPEVGEMSTL